MVFTDFTGLTSNEMNALRRELKAIGARLSVMKKRLVRVVFEGHGVSFDPKGYEGQLGVVFSPKDAVETAGLLVEATAVREQIATDSVAIYGPDHPETLDARGSLAAARGRAGDDAGAAREFEKLVQDRTRIQGADHPDTLRQRSAMLSWLRDTDRLRIGLRHVVRVVRGPVADHLCVDPRPASAGPLELLDLVGLDTSL